MYKKVEMRYLKENEVPLKKLTEFNLNGSNWIWSAGEICRYIQFIYVKVMDGIERIKITERKHPVLRRDDHTCNPCASELVLVLVLGVSRHISKDIEKAIHKQFEHLHHHGKWFEYGDEIKSFISTYK